MDRASIALAQGFPAGVPKSYRALADHRGVPHSTLHHRSRGRPSIEAKAQKQQYLTPAEEEAVIKFILQMSALGRPIRIKHIPALAFSATLNRPLPDRPTKPPGKNWVRRLEKRHPDIQARQVKPLDWNRHEINTHDKIRSWFEVVGKVIQNADILAENLYNMDETGVMLSMPGSIKVLLGRTDTRDYRGVHIKRETVTAIECISADGRALNPMIIWPATTHRSNWTMFPTPGWHYACSESGYTNSHISLEWLKRVFDPQTKERAGCRPRALICDGFGTHETLDILEYCFANNIILCRLPSHTSHKLQPCDVAVFAPLKAAYRDNVNRLERAGVGTIGKQHFTSLYSPARDIALNAKNITSGWRKAGLYPFDPDRVLSNLPSRDGGVFTVDKLKRIDDTSILDAIPQTPLTPVSIEALTALQDIIVQQHACALDHTSKESLVRHLQKVTKAASIFHTTSALQHDEIKFLQQANSEARVRRVAKSKILGRAKVMSYDDLVAARAKRAEKQTAQEHKMRRGRRRKRDCSELATDALEQASTNLGRDEDGNQEAATEVLLRAPVAHMY